MNDTCITRQNIDDFEQRYRATLINSLSGFKSASLIGTSVARRQQENLAVVSSVVHIGANPPLLGMIMRPHTVVRDTLENIQATGVYTINHIHKSWTDKAHQTSARYDKNQSEFEATGLSPWYSDGFAAPYVAQSPVKLGMKLASVIPIELNNTQLVIGSIEQVWLNNELIEDDGSINLTDAGIACISGLDTYLSTRRIARYAYAKPDKPPQKLL